MIIGLDVGGTNTDIVLVGENGLERKIKVPTDTSDLFQTVLTGIEKITANIPSEKIKHAVLSTTLTTNAIVRNKLSPAGIFVSAGPGLNPEAYRTNKHYFNVSGTIDHNGKEINAIDKNQIEEIAHRLKSEGIRHVGVVGKFSTRNPEHELEIQKIIAPYFDKIFLGHRISGHLNFPRRIATTFLNASVYPIHKEFFEAVKSTLKQNGILIPIYILKADGGTMAFDASIDFPGQSVLSGPSASVMGSVAFAPEDSETIVMDIGGTTTDMAVLINQVPLLSPLGIEIGPYKTLIRALNSYSIGIGGDSVVRIEDGVLKIGPDRTGPAMAYGGSVPTPTDALFVLDKTNDASGDKNKSLQGITPIAAKLGLSVEEAAFEIFDLACQDILTAARKMIGRINSKPVYTIKEVLSDYQLKPRHIMVLGGPASYFAEHMEQISEFTVRTVPQWSVANAIGTALSRTTCEVSLFADTQKRVAMAPEESFSKQIPSDFTKDDALALGHELLKQKALQTGADINDLDPEVLEELEFNMVRGFRLTGKNIRIKLQVKPGLINNYKMITDKIAAM
ncbi:MAG: hydantoinase/oxoprolinase family protein [Desulfobacteraceae bacterium]|jgi:N-methylhydantoinase A|nr:hydantoinase/oxoprolinase family protein [Desulfobacteraceae bacterium]